MPGSALWSEAVLCTSKTIIMLASESHLQHYHEQLVNGIEKRDGSVVGWIRVSSLALVN